MIVRHFDNFADFLAYVTAKGGTIERLKTEYALDDPATQWNMYPLAVAVDGTWAAVCDFPTPSTEPDWQGATKITSWTS